MREVTVVIPNYNGIAYIEECIKALQAQQGVPAFDIIVVDNHSTDGSKEFVLEHYKEICLIPLDDNYGFCKAVNVGIKAAKTPYVILLNNDTQVQPGFVAALYDRIRQKSSIFSVSSMMLQAKNPTLIDDAGDYYCALGWAFARGKDKQAAEYDIPCEITAACAGAAIYRKQIFEQIGYFDEVHFAYLEDIDVGYRARLYGYQNMYEPKAKVYHVGSGASGSRYNEFKVRHSSRNSIYLIRKNMPILQQVINLPFFMVGFLVKSLFFAKKGLGRTYFAGLWKGMCLPLQGKKVYFQAKHWKNYVKLQVELWVNVIKRFL